MKSSRHTLTHGFTLVELLAATVIMSIISVILMPIIVSASDSYITARQVRSSTERAGFALDRLTRIVRQAPIGSGNVGVGITTATSDSIVFSDGTGVQLSGSTLEMLVPGNDPAPLCFLVESFEVRFLADDGVTNTVSDPTKTHRIVFTVITDGVEMSVLVHPRVWIGQVSS